MTSDTKEPDGWELDVGVPLIIPEDGDESMDSFMRVWNEINEVLERAVGKESGSSGTGLGYRDKQWLFDSEQEAKDAEARVREAITKELGFTEFHSDTENLPTNLPYTSVYESGLIPLQWLEEEVYKLLLTFVHDLDGEEADAIVIACERAAHRFTTPERR